MPHAASAAFACRLNLNPLGPSRVRLPEPSKTEGWWSYQPSKYIFGQSMTCFSALRSQAYGASVLGASTPYPFVSQPPDGALRLLNCRVSIIAMLTPLVDFLFPRSEHATTPRVSD